MRYPIAIEPGTDATAWGVVVPDLPGCFSAGDTLEEAMIQAEDVCSNYLTGRGHHLLARNSAGTEAALSVAIVQGAHARDGHLKSSCESAPV